ncbi:MAG: hypothetical protein ACYCVB_06630 [Bacilli bacterium]
MDRRDVLTLMFDKEVDHLPEEVLEEFPKGQDYVAARAKRDELMSRLAAQLSEEQHKMLRDLDDLYSATTNHHSQCFYRIGFVRGISALDNRLSVLYAAGWRPSNQMLDKMTRTTGTN